MADLKDDTLRQFEEGADEGQGNLLLEFWDFLRHNKKWWLVPIVVAMLLFGLLVVLIETAGAPLIYTIF